MSTSNPVSRQRIEVDLNFVNEVTRRGGGDVKKCMQCSECSVVCPLSPSESPFPRKEMLWTQWGLKDKLMADPDIWMCHNCEDCSKECPRNAKPGSVLGALRSMVIETYSWPRAISRAFSKKTFLALFALVPVALMILFFLATGIRVPNGGPIYFSSLVPYNYLDTAGIIVGAYAILALLYGCFRYYRTLSKQKKGKMNAVTAAILTLKDVILHTWFSVCGSNRNRYYAHILIFYGFCVLLLATFTGALEIHVFGFSHALLGEPQNIMGNIGTVLILPGLLIAIINRTTSKVPKEDTYFDWFFLILLLLIVCTGFVMELFRLDGISLAYWTYMIHLILVFMLVAYFPYSKFAHLAYRFFALTYLTSIGRRPAV